MHAVIGGYLKRIRALSAEAKERLQSELNVEIATLIGADKEAAQDLFEDIVQSLADFDDVVNDIIDEIKLRFSALDPQPRTHPNGCFPCITPPSHSTSGFVTS